MLPNSSAQLDLAINLVAVSAPIAAKNMATIVLISVASKLVALSQSTTTSATSITTVRIIAQIGWFGSCMNHLQKIRRTAERTGCALNTLTGTTARFRTGFVCRTTCGTVAMRLTVAATVRRTG